MIIRKAVMRDIPETCKMAYDLNECHRAFDDYFAQSKNAMQEFLKLHRKALNSSGSIFLVAEDGGKVIGFAMAKVEKRPGVYSVKNIGFINAVYVKKEYRRSGVFRSFMSQMTSWFRDRGIRYLELQVHPGNEQAMKAYGRCGFETFLLGQRMKI